MPPLRWCLLLWSLTLTVTRESHGDEVKDAIQHSIRALRSVQNADGSYGADGDRTAATARFLLALGSCEEGYTTFDGPFARRGVAALLTLQNGDGSFGADDRPDLTQQALLALAAAAPGAHPEVLTRARGYLAEHGLAADGDLRARFPGQQADRPFLTQWLGRAPADAELKGLAEALAADQERALADLTPISAASVATRLLALIDLAAALKPASSSSAAPPAELTLRAVPRSATERRERVLAALAFLERQQTDGRFGLGSTADAGITAITLSAVMKTCAAHGLPRPPYVDAGLDYLLGLQQADGGIYDQGLKNYVTALSVEAMTAARDPRFGEAIDQAIAFLKATQLDENEGYSSEEDPYYGGFGYGSSEKPDLSNTQASLQALHDAGLAKDDAAWRKATLFLARCQNLPETGAPPMETSDGRVLVPGDDGGAIYRPGNSKAGETPVGGNRFASRSYGSMTYALLKSYLFAGLDPADERVQAAVTWIGANYTVTENPGFQVGRADARYQGLFYYYLTMARALSALGVTDVRDAAGVAHDWRAELADQVLSMQGEDGGWINLRSSRWMEANPILTTAYALLALTEIG